MSSLPYYFSISVYLNKRHIDEVIKTVDLVNWSWKFSIAGMLFWSIVGLVLGIVLYYSAAGSVGDEIANACFIVFSLICPLSLGVSYGLVQRGVPKKIIPNYGMIKTAKSAIITGSIFMLSWSIISYLGFGSVWGYEQGAVIGLSWGIAGFLVGSLLHFNNLNRTFNLDYVPEKSIIMHFILRLFLAARGYAPLNYASFLEFLCQRKLMIKIGGAYKFLHATFQRYFSL